MIDARRVPVQSGARRASCLRHNRGMRWLRTLLFALILFGLAAGCGRGGGPGTDGDATLSGLGAGEGAVEWRGSLPCADCQVIDTRLVLKRSGGEHLYELVEVYVAVDGSMRFDEAGQWRLDNTVLSLEPSTGGLRRYGLLRGGGLQVRDPRGRAFPGREGDVLLPVGRHP